MIINLLYSLQYMKSIYKVEFTDAVTKLKLNPQEFVDFLKKFNVTKKDMELNKLTATVKGNVLLFES